MSSQLLQIQEAAQDLINNNQELSLLNFLQYRKKTDYFTNDKAKEHYLYKKTLEFLSKDYEQARIKLFYFEVKYILYFQREWVQGLEYVPVPGQLHFDVSAITQLDGYALTGCQVTRRVMNEKSSEGVKDFWISNDKERHNCEIQNIQLNYTKQLLEETNNEKNKVRTITTNNAIKTLQNVLEDKYSPERTQESQDFITKNSQNEFSCDSVQTTTNVEFYTPARQSRYYSPDPREDEEEGTHEEEECLQEGREENPFIDRLLMTEGNFKENKKGPWRLSIANRREIDVAFLSMKKENMWRLRASGKLVEEELYKPCGIHSFIVDVDDELMKQHFSEAELLEIENEHAPEVPQLSQDIINYLLKFYDKKTLKEIRKAINEYDERFDVEYNQDVYHDLDYIRFALYALEIENGGLKSQNLEAWYNCHIWNIIVDQGFADIEEASVVRGESVSTANSGRKNAHRESANKRRMYGHKGDWILRRDGSGERDEYDMLLKLMKKVNWDRELCKKLQTVGIIHAGYVCRIRRGDLMEVPYVEENFSDILQMLAAVINIKAIVRETIKTVQSKPVQSSTQVSEKFIKAGITKRPRNTHEIPS
ncbi:13499_t:CDS:10, partial [Racocetra persica]